MDEAMRERAAMAVYEALISSGRWMIFPPRDPANLPTYDEYLASKVEACFAAVDAVVATVREDRWPLGQ